MPHGCGAGPSVRTLAATWKFIARDYPTANRTALVRLYALASVIGDATCEEELADVEQDIDDILKFEPETHVHRHTDAADIAALGLATHRLGESTILARSVTRDLFGAGWLPRPGRSARCLQEAARGFGRFPPHFINHLLEADANSLCNLPHDNMRDRLH